MNRILFFTVLLMVIITQRASSQPHLNVDGRFTITVINEKRQFTAGATVTLVNTENKITLKTGITNQKGEVEFFDIVPGEYYFTISSAGYQSQVTSGYTFPLATGTDKKQTIQLLPAVTNMQEVTVTGNRPFIQHQQGKVIINPEASVTNVGTSVLELLEKSPGVLVDKNGTVSLQGKTGVLVLIDDKPTFLSGTELSNLLGSMSSTQVDQIELIANPSAKYAASENAGIINIKTKKNKQKGFNGTINMAVGQGRYPKNNGSLLLNYRNGKFNSFLNYTVNRNKYFTDLYALRTYYTPAGSLAAILDQPTIFSGTVFSNTIKTGFDYYASRNTTIGLSLTGVLVNREGSNGATATWKNPQGGIDSSIGTNSTSGNRFRNGAVNLYMKQVINQSQDLSIDVDWLNYAIRSEQFFNNRLISPGGYTLASRGNIPSTIEIVSAKADHTFRFGKAGKLESGWKSSHISTDNLANYQLSNGTNWLDDLDKSNHFLYKEKYMRFIAT